VLQAWPGVRVLYVDSQLPGGDPQVGNALSLRAQVALNGLTPDDVCVEAVYGTVDTDDRLTRSTAVVLNLAETVDGTSWFVGEVPLERTGSFGYTVRALPKNDLLAEPAELGVVAVA
jgi:starch phosphorylase